MSGPFHTVEHRPSRRHGDLGRPAGRRDEHGRGVGVAHGCPRVTTRLRDSWSSPREGPTRDGRVNVRQPSSRSKGRDGSSRDDHSVATHRHETSRSPPTSGRSGPGRPF
jgi:hypothetical protein